MKGRDKILQLFGGHCAYCGCALGRTWHADHVQPIYRGRLDAALPDHAGADEKENLFPSCPRCNRRKGVLSIEGFRREIQIQAERLRRDSSAFRLAEDFCAVAATGKPIVFWFEKYSGGAHKGGEA